MKTDILQQQYALVCSSRNVLLNYCETISKQHFRAGLVDFGGRSIHYMLIHVVNTYKFWLGEFGMNQKQDYENYSIENIKDVRELYEGVDRQVQQFLLHFRQKPGQEVSGKIKQYDGIFTRPALDLFTHVITHEFHHKGQIMTMSRMLGYIPPDADIVRFT